MTESSLGNVVSKRLVAGHYDELRGLAPARFRRERTGPTLNATGLVHEAYLPLAGRTRFFLDRFSARLQ